jgi:hypothetical protein
MLSAHNAITIKLMEALEDFSVIKILESISCAGSRTGGGRRDNLHFSHAALIFAL